MKRIIFTEELCTDTEGYLLNLAVNELIHIETGVGVITVQRNHNEAEGWIRAPFIYEKGIGVRCSSALEAFINLIKIGQHYSAEYRHEQEEIDMGQEIISRMAPIDASLVACERDRLGVQISAVSVLSANFDKTLFATSAAGLINRQTLHYPLESENVFGDCDCLRFRSTTRPCEHLILIAYETIFVDAPELMEAPF